MGDDQSSRILAYLAKAEFTESDAWHKDSYRLAWLTTLYCSRSVPEPFIQAHYQIFGIHPDNLQGALESRRRAKLGTLYDQFFPAMQLPPKKQPAKVQLPQIGEERQSKPAVGE